MHQLPSRSISLIASACFAAGAAAQPKPMWLEEFGGKSTDWATRLAPAPGGGVFVAGMAQGDIAGPEPDLAPDNNDCYLARYDAAGERVWALKFGVPLASDFSYGLAPDNAGGAFVAGDTWGDLGGINNGEYSSDVFLARYDGDGSRIWITQFGTPTADRVRAIAPDGVGGVFLTGQTYGTLGGPNSGGADIFLARYDGAGRRLWIRQVGSSKEDYAEAAAPDSVGGVFIAGHSIGSLGGQNLGSRDVVVARYDALGRQIWMTQFGTPKEDEAYAAAPDGEGGVFVAGHTFGSFGGPNAGGPDVFVARYDAQGGLVWITQFGTDSFDLAVAAASDDKGTVFVAGRTGGKLGGPYWPGVYVIRLDAAGGRIWASQFGSKQLTGRALTSDTANGVFVTGETNMGNVYLARFGPACFADCDASNSLDVNDVICFQRLVATKDFAADCDHSGVIDVSDFICFQTAFAAGCP